MKLAIMQPYLFPYIGYYQLIHAADKFVIYDDVNYIKKGWINRNRILCNGKPLWFQVPLEGASQNKKICNTKIFYGSNWQRKLRKSFEHCYSKAKYYDEIIAIATDVFDSEWETIDNLAYQSIKLVVEYLEIDTQIVRSSRDYQNDHLKGQERILDICKRVGANTYINAVGGKTLYAHHQFISSGVKLSFLQSVGFEYKQLSNTFWPFLSILDVLMNNGRKNTQKILNCYQIDLPGD